MEENRSNEIPRHRKEILRLLRALWKLDGKEDFRMWIQIYTIIHCFCKDKGGGEA